MSKVTIQLEGYKETLFHSDTGEIPFQFKMTIPPNAASVTRLAADSLHEQLMEIIPGNNQEVHIAKSTYNGNEIVPVFATMIVVKLEYVETSPRYLTLSFSLDEESLVLH
jgi:hypothetical protein